MKELKHPAIIITTLVLFFYVIAPYVGVSLAVVYFLAMLMPVLLIWTVIRILKDPEPSKKKWSDGHWYEDVDINRVDE